MLSAGKVRMPTNTSSGFVSNTSSPLLIVGVDPSSGSSSPVGLSIFDPQTMDILEAVNLHTKHKKLEHRIKDLADQLETVFKVIEKDAPEYKVIVAIETFVMAGKSGQILQNAIGAFLSRVPYHFQVELIQNTTMKKVIGGTGSAEKKTIGRGLEAFFEDNIDSFKLIKQLTDRGEVDIIDSIGLGVTAWLKSKKTDLKSPLKPTKKPR